ncbi:MAG: hypothetical protein ABIG89_01985 [Candidatus Woesearchaeota archaeon]
MLLDINNIHTDYIKHILPYIKKGIFIDTSIMKIFLDGFIELRFSNKKNENYDNLISLFEHLKVHNKWGKFWITPHLFTEICQHFCQDNNRCKRQDFNKIVESVIPILKDINEETIITKDKMLELIDIEKPVIEMGDLSIYIAIDKFLEEYKKTAIIVKDDGIKRKYENYPNVMVIDYNKTILDLELRK